MPVDFLQLFLNDVSRLFALPVIGGLWWFWAFIILFLLAQALWLTYVQEHYRRSNPSVLLELRFPREVRKNPKAMEQVFYSIHALINSPSNLQERWWDGEITLTFSCEIASFGGEVHFFLRTPKKHRAIVEANIYSQYPDIEITEVDDYVKRMPPTFDTVASNGYEMFGNELRLEKPDAYPIRTYVEFEAMEEEQKVDPISAVLEVLAKIKPQEVVWLQIIIRPVDDTWVKDSEALVEELIADLRKRRTVTDQSATEGPSFSYAQFTPGDRELIEAIERNIGKPGFETLIRYLYFSPPELYSANFGQRGLYSAFNQYASEWLNRFKHNIFAWTRASYWYWPYLFPKHRALAKKRRIYKNFRERWMYEQRDSPFLAQLLNIDPFHFGVKAQRIGRMILNTEELATIFHPPTFIVLTGSLMKRVEAKKVGPPAGLPIYGDEDQELPGLKK